MRGNRIANRRWSPQADPVPASVSGGGTDESLGRGRLALDSHSRRSDAVSASELAGLGLAWIRQRDHASRAADYLQVRHHRAGLDMSQMSTAYVRTRRRVSVLEDRVPEPMARRVSIARHPSEVPSEGPEGTDPRVQMREVSGLASNLVA